MLTQYWYQIGNLNVPSTWLAFLVAGLLTGIIVWLLFGKSVSSVYSDYFFYFIITWKLSVVITDFSTVMKQPLALLYYSSGTFGVFAGLAVVVLLFFLKKDKSITFEQAVETLILFYSLFFMSVVLFNHSSVWETAIIVICIWGYLVALRFSFKESISDRLVSFLVLYTFVHILYDVNVLEVSLLSAYLLGIVLVGVGYYRKKKIDKKWNLSVTMLLVCLGIWTVSDAVQNNSPTVQADRQESRKAENFTLNNMNGEQVQLSDYEGKKVILNFWATWCPPCQAEMPHMQKYYEDYAEAHNAEILAVNLTSQDRGQQQIQDFITDYELDFPVLLDEEGEIASMYQIIAIPTTFLLDETGRVMKEVKGPISTEFLIQQLGDTE